ncbi:MULTISPECIES: ASCH domain-containing protein [Proteus]|uniref:hypothetical protein n=1 Tax=Proteus TaxID=583 RepID=UPI000EF0E618|nr:MULTISPECIES: hypothetical protein [Proteus]HCN43718.1 hypothetical protein [Proteus vulgaris]MDM3773119.1 hypothetical protein [Proteus mirabilis]QKD68558.1 hypothetical protein HG541_03755 [Proteus terrae subsp. cibarius]QKD73733.1 hypothetical protein HG539_13165 [Proteus terrae subsp. cibarius]UDF25164.1 hypothetical protein LHA39_13720 [Proteus terrae subsp. cibarius]
MKERGIIFNAEMVKAILDGRKTQTRRIVKNVMLDNGIWLKKPTKTRSGTTTHVLDAPKHNLCPLGKIGDRLYVREAFKAGVCTESTIAYKATHKPSDLEEGWYEEIKWTPSIHMPRRYSRITLEITNIRVERLNDISNDDAKSEGCWYGRGGGVPDKALTPSDQFPTLWEEIYGDGSWSSNPWVWVIEFKRI